MSMGPIRCEGCGTIAGGPCRPGCPSDELSRLRDLVRTIRTMINWETGDAIPRALADDLDIDLDAMRAMVGSVDRKVELIQTIRTLIEWEETGVTERKKAEMMEKAIEAWSLDDDDAWGLDDEDDDF